MADEAPRVITTSASMQVETGKEGKGWPEGLRESKGTQSLKVVTQMVERSPLSASQLGFQRPELHLQGQATSQHLSSPISKLRMAAACIPLL